MSDSLKRSAGLTSWDQAYEIPTNTVGSTPRGTEPEFIEGDVFKAIIPIKTGQATGEVSGEVQEVVNALHKEMKLKELMDALDL